MAQAEALQAAEIYLSVQGESSFAGWPCVFVRLAGCPLRCSYCDTAYAFRGGRRISVEEALDEVDRLAEPFRKRPTKTRLPLVEVTGGEPLAQPAALPLMRKLADKGFTVLLETSGALDIGGVDPRVRRIMDIKCPGSGEAARNRWENIDLLRPPDEVKFVIGSREDYQWAKETVARFRLTERCETLFSWAEPPAEPRDPALKPPPPGLHPISRRELAERILADALPVRFQIQTHKVIWPPNMRGV